MPNTTTNYNLTKPFPREKVNVNIINNNMDLIDTNLKSLSDNKIDKTVVATSQNLGLIKSGTDISVDSKGNVNVNDDSHNHSNYLPHSTIKTTTDLNTIKSTGVYHINVSGCTNAPVANWGTLYVEFATGTPYQIYIADGDNNYIYRRGFISSTWSEWQRVNETLTYSSTEPTVNLYNNMVWIGD